VDNEAGSRYVNALRTYVTTVCRDCGWNRLADVRLDRFLDWRNRKQASEELWADTLNKYLSGWRVLFTWLKQLKRVSENPFVDVEKIKTYGEKKSPHRSYTKEELERIIYALPDKYKPGAWLSIYSCLRHNEIRHLKWSDFNLNEENPSLTTRARASKNRKRAVLPLRRDMAAIMRQIRPSDFLADDLAFPHFPRFCRLKKYWIQAGIPERDEFGGRSTFHSLRKSMSNLLADANVPERTADDLTRHSRGMTYGTYVDPNYLPKRNAVECLPAIGLDLQTQKQTQNMVAGGHSASLGGKDATEGGDLQVIAADKACHGMSASGERREMVGVAGFEPATFCSQSRRASQAAPYPENNSGYTNGIFPISKWKHLSGIESAAFLFPFGWAVLGERTDTPLFLFTLTSAEKK